MTDPIDAGTCRCECVEYLCAACADYATEVN